MQTLESWSEPRLIPGLACPACHHPLGPVTGSSTACGSCQQRYPVVDGIPSFMPGDSADRPPSEAIELSVILLGSEGTIDPALLDEIARLGISYDIAEAEAADVGSALQRSRGRYVMTIDAGATGLMPKLWFARDDADVVTVRRPVAGRQTNVANGAARRILSVPASDVGSPNRIYRRPVIEAIAGSSRTSTTQAAILVDAVAAGYTVNEIAPDRDRPSPGTGPGQRRIRVRTLYQLWKLRNSIASADYDARAYDSIVPLQRYWQRRRHHIITRAAAGFQCVLDVGCGSSRILSAPLNMVGLDIQLHKLRYARRFGKPLVHGSIFSLPFSDAAFDCVICSEVIEHIPAEEKVFDELLRVLRPDGRLILGTPDYDRRRWRMLEWLYARAAPGGYADEHITHYSRTNLQRYLEGRGLTVESVDYVGGAEMIFTLKKSTPSQPSSARLDVTSGLRTAGAPARNHPEELHRLS